MRVTKILMFCSAIACATLLMASRDSRPAAACSTPTLSVSCTNGNPSTINFSGCDWNACGAGPVYIYAHCDSSCGGSSCVEVTSSTSSSPRFGCQGWMLGSYNVSCSNPDQEYVCAKDQDNNVIAVSVGYCDCIQSPT